MVPGQNAGSVHSDTPAAGAAPAVLVVGTDEWAIEQAAEALAGEHVVLRCTEPGAPAFPCVGVLDPAACPLTCGADVVLAVRNRVAADLTPREAGVVCALHNRTPLVAAGMSTGAPYEHLATRVVGPDENVGRCCREAATVDLRTEAVGP